MKLHRLLLLTGIGASLILASCNNFMQSSLLKNELEEIIKDASVERVEISVFALNAYGTLTGETGGSYKIGTENLSLGFTENKGWQFVEWLVSDADGNKTGCSLNDKIYIKNPLSSKTTFSINESAPGYKIEAVCMARPEVEVFSPSYIANGINADTPIEITFAHEVNAENFIFSKQEFEAYGNPALAIRKDSGDESSDIVAISLAGEVLFKNISITDSNGINIAAHYKAPVLSADKKKITLNADTSKVFDFSGASVKDVFVKVSDNVSYDYESQNEKIVKVVLEKQSEHNFKISSTTTEKAKIFFSAKNDEDKSVGKLNYNGEQEFNIGQTIKIEFEPNNEFNFVSWNILGNENNAVSVKEDGAVIFIKVLKATDTVKIVPVCEEKAKAQVLFTSTNGVMSPVGYVECMQGQVMPLSFSCDPSYKFIQWKVVNTNTGETVEKEIADLYYQFEDENAQSTFLTIKNPKDVYSIVADCYVRPHVYSHYPDINSGSDVKRDQSVKIYFDHDIDRQSLYYTEDEAAQVQKSIGFAGFLYDSTGRYGYKTSDNNQVFKNITITNRATGENYTKFYKQPQLLDARTLVVPVKVVLVSGSTDIDDTQTLPEHTEVMFQLGDKVGYYAENGDLVSLVLDSNLTWFYKNNGGVDTDSPVVVSSSIMTSGSGSKSLSKVEPVSDNKQSLKDAALSNLRVDYIVTVKDDSDNLSTLILKYSHIKTIGSTLTDVPSTVFYEDSPIHSKVLNLVSSDGKNGTSSATIDLNDLNYKMAPVNSFSHYRLQRITDTEGVHKIWFEVTDECGNTGESEPYYIVVDKTGPKKSVRSNSVKFFKDGVSKIKVCDWKFDEDLSCDYDSTAMYVKYSGQADETPYPMDDVNEFIFNGSLDSIRIVAKDVFGNEQKISTVNDVRCGPSLYNGCYYYADGWYSGSTDDYSSEYKKLGIYYSGYIVYDGKAERLTKAQADEKLSQLNSSMSAEEKAKVTWTYPPKNFVFVNSAGSSFKIQSITGVDPANSVYSTVKDYFWFDDGTKKGFAYYGYDVVTREYRGPNYKEDVGDTDTGYLVIVHKL